MVIILITFNSMGQQETILDSFTATENEGTVFLRWVISSGKTCDGIKIFRSDDTIGFVQIGDIGGICGSPDSPQPYSFTDENPLKNKVNYYRLELGTAGYSVIVSVEVIDLNENSYQLRPNPVSNSARLYFMEEDNKAYTLIIYNLSGSTMEILPDVSSPVLIDAYNLKNGMYLFSLLENGNRLIITGKLIVQK